MKKAFLSLLAAIIVFVSVVVKQPAMPALAMESEIHYKSNDFVNVSGEEMHSCEFVPEFPSICIMIA